MLKHTVIKGLIVAGIVAAGTVNAAPASDPGFGYDPWYVEGRVEAQRPTTTSTAPAPGFGYDPWYLTSDSAKARASSETPATAARRAAVDRYNREHLLQGHGTDAAAVGEQFGGGQ
jgi:inosine/xanthosine triphosphate pyrophosphatase family protein